MRQDKHIKIYKSESGQTLVDCNNVTFEEIKTAHEIYINAGDMGVVRITYLNN